MNTIIKQANTMIEHREIVIAELEDSKKKVELHINELREKVKERDVILDTEKFTKLTQEVGIAEAQLVQIQGLIDEAKKPSETEQEAAVALCRALDAQLKAVNADCHERLQKDAEKLYTIIEAASGQQSEIHQIQNKLKDTFGLAYVSCISSEGVLRTKAIGSIYNGLRELMTASVQKNKL